MGDTTGDVAQPSAAETSLINTVKALLKDSGRAASQKGMLRWNLHKKVLTNPSYNHVLVKELVRNLHKCINKIENSQPHVRVLPVLYTLYYVVLQSPAVISAKLYQAMYGCLMKLLILPQPYCAVARSTLKSIKMEMFTPGSLYHRRIIAEQSLRSDHLKLQDRVFVLADPEVFSGPLEATVRADLEVSSSMRDPLQLKRSVVQRLMQYALGSYCHSPTLTRALQSLGDSSVDGFFQETVLVVEQGVRQGHEGWRDYIDSLQIIYTNILTSADQTIGFEEYSATPVTMPYPEINFILWDNEDDLWNLLSNFALGSSSSFDAEEKIRRSSVLSQDSGIEKDLKEGDFENTPKSPISTMGLSRRMGFKSPKSGNKLTLVNDKMDRASCTSSKAQLSHTARVVVMGDDRILGKLANAYRNIREMESKHIRLTKKMNLQFYYIPVTDTSPTLTLRPDVPVQEEIRLSLASYLGKIDPWYDSNINYFQTAIPKLAGMHMNHSRPSERDLFFLDTLCYYLRCGMQKVNLPLYRVMMTRSSNGVSSQIEEVFVSSLEADITEFRHLKDKSPKPSNHRKRSVEVFGGVMSVSYGQTSVSKRVEMKGVCPMACGAIITSEPSTTYGEDYLGVRFNSVNPEENTKILTKTINIKAMENRTLMVCLDKDHRRTYNDIQRIEVVPCLDPGCNIQCKFTLSVNKELPLSKYVDKVLSLPINTFSGVTN